MEDFETAANTEQVELATPETETQSIEEPIEIETKPDITETQAFAQRLREERAKIEAEVSVKASAIERDYTIAKKYGKDYGVFSEADIAAIYGNQGITTLAELEEAIENTEMANQGIDPDVLNQKLNQKLEHHPDVVAAREAQKRTENYADFEKFYTETVGAMPNIKDLPQEVIQAFNRGESMRQAFVEWDYKNLRSTKKAEEVNEKNAVSSTGSVTGNGNGKELTLTQEMINEMSPKELASRWQEVKAVFKMK